MKWGCVFAVHHAELNFLDYNVKFIFAVLLLYAFILHLDIRFISALLPECLHQWPHPLHTNASSPLRRSALRSRQHRSAPPFTTQIPSGASTQPLLELHKDRPSTPLCKRSLSETWNSVSRRHIRQHATPSASSGSRTSAAALIKRHILGTSIIITPFKQQS